MYNYFLPDYSTWKFPSGEVGVKVNDFKNCNGAMLLRMEVGNFDVMEWFQIIDSFNRNTNWSREVYIPFLPFSRQDRVCHFGESLSLEVFISCLASLGVKSLYCYDVHNKDAYQNACANANIKFSSYPNILPTAVHKAFVKLPYDVIFYPDRSASEHGIAEILSDLNCNDIKKIYLKKERFTLPMNTPEVVFSMDRDRSDIDSVDGLHVLINDDICDGGKTFITACNTFLTGAAKIDLFVTHGLFTGNYQDLLDGGISNIYTTNSVKNPKLLQQPSLTIIDIFNGDL